MRLYYLLLFIALSVTGQTIRKTVCASGCDYTNTYTGLNTALSDAAISQHSACAPYLIEIDPANVIDLMANTVVLPAKTCAQYVRIRSMRMADLPPDGTRIDTSSTALARIQKTTGSFYGSSYITGPTSKTRYWSFEGLDFYGNMDVNTHSLQIQHKTSQYGTLLQLGEENSTFPASTDPGRRMDHIEVKHCWFHGIPGRMNVQRGIAINANNVLVADSVIEEIAGTGGGEAQALIIVHSEGPVDIINNVLDSVTENTIIGGALMPAGNLPSFIRFIGNVYRKQGNYKHLTNFGTSDAPTYPCRPGNVFHVLATSQDYTCSGGGLGTWGPVASGVWLDPGAGKNVWEAKIARGVRIYGNDLSGAWRPSAQSSDTFTFNLAAQPAFSGPLWVSPTTGPGTDGFSGQPWTTLSDISLSANKVHDGMTFVNFAYPANGITAMILACANEGGVSVPPWCYPNAHNNFRIYDNLVTNMSDERDYVKSFLPDARGFGFVLRENIGSFNSDFRHNTFIPSTTTANSGQMIAMLSVGGDNGTSKWTGYNNVRDNIMPAASTTIQAFPSAQGGECGWRSGLRPGGGGTADLTGNTIITSGGGWSYSFTTGLPCSGTNVWPVGTIAAANNAAAVDGNFRAVIPNTASDGRDAGANIDRVNYATAGAVSGAYNSALEYKIRSAIPTQTGAKIYFTANSSNDCTWELSTNPDNYASPIAVTSQTRNGRDGIATWAGTLAPATVYFARVTSDGLKLEHGINGSRFMFMTAPGSGGSPPTAEPLR